MKLDPTQPDGVRWVDRLTMDGTWSGNVYDFYRLVYRRLVRDLRVPFRLRGGQRIDDTPVHEALREALANALSHADYWGSGGVVVLKEPDGFSSRIPARCVFHWTWCWKADTLTPATTPSTACF